MLSLDDVQLEMEKGNMLPERAADLLIVVAAKYGRAADEYIKANAEYAKEFNLQRGDFKSDTATERYLDVTEKGLNRHFWKYQLKRAEQILKALNGLIYYKTAEAKNQM